MVPFGNLPLVMRLAVDINLSQARVPSRVGPETSCNLFRQSAYLQKKEVPGMDTTLLRPIWARIFRRAWFLNLVLFLIMAGIRCWG